MSKENANDILSQRALQALVEEARTATPAEATANIANIDWNRVDASLFARVEREAAEVRALAVHRGRPGAWLLLGGVAAAAAAVAVFVQPGGHQGAPVSPVAVMSSAGDLTLQKGAGEILVDGAKARAGAHARAGDTIGTRGAKAVFDAPGRVSWLLEDESKVTVERGAGAPVVLALRQGALEAQVAPVASGEAFAVDVDGIRVAVHGTHLRVARDGDHVVVDLTEGVVSIGAPPKSGSTYGTLVTAPAHIEFHSDALGATLMVDHASSSVRRAADLDSVMDEETSASVTPPSRPAEPRADDHIDRVAPAPQRPPSTAQARPMTAARNPNAESDLVSIVRACATAHQSSDLKVTPPDETATVTLYEDGKVKRVDFNPWPSPAIVACAKEKILELRFVDSAEHKIAISFEAP
jgi:FecR-like protein